MAALAPKSVPCDGCTLCCRGQEIRLFPELGDRPEDFVTEASPSPFGGQGFIIPHKPDGSCHYLGDAGCTIHDRLPLVCRTFDCREEYTRIPRAERRRRAKVGLIDNAVVQRGRQLLEGK